MNGLSEQKSTVFFLDVTPQPRARNAALGHIKTIFAPLKGCAGLRKCAESLYTCSLFTVSNFSCVISMSRTPFRGATFSLIYPGLRSLPWATVPNPYPGFQASNSAISGGCLGSGLGEIIAEVKINYFTIAKPLLILNPG